MDGDIPWLYVAMIFIAFLSWIFNQIKEATEIRREKIAEKKRAQRARMTTEPEYESPYRRSTPAGYRTDEDEPETFAEEDQVTGGPKSFRDIFKEIEQQLHEQEIEPEPVRTPPPLPSGAPPPPSIAEAPLTIADSPALGRFPSGVNRKRRRPRRNRETSDALRETLRDGKQLKNALILREILGPPRSKQHEVPRSR